MPYAENDQRLAEYSRVVANVFILFACPLKILGYMVICFKSVSTLPLPG